MQKKSRSGGDSSIAPRKTANDNMVETCHAVIIVIYEKKIIFKNQNDFMI